MERAKSLQAVVIARLDFMSSMTEALISKVLKRLQQQGLCRQGMEEPIQYIAFAFGLYINLCTDMQNRVHVIYIA